LCKLAQVYLSNRLLNYQTDSLFHRNDPLGALKTEKNTLLNLVSLVSSYIVALGVAHFNNALAVLFACHSLLYILAMGLMNNHELSF